MGASIMIAAGVMGALGVICAVCLGVAGRLLAVASDPRIDALEELFGGTNCGACGYAGCRAAAEAMVGGDVGVDVCELGGAEVAASAAGIVGLDTAQPPLQVDIVQEAPTTVGAQNGNGESGNTPVSRDSIGPVSVSPKSNEGKPVRKKRELPPPVPLNPGEMPVIDKDACIACGLCVRACTDGAIAGEPKTIPTINLENCTLCGRCVVSCRKGFISVQKKEDV